MNSLPRYLTNALFSLFKWLSTVLYARRNFIAVSHGAMGLVRGFHPSKLQPGELRSCSRKML